MGQNDLYNDCSDLPLVIDQDQVPLQLDQLNHSHQLHLDDQAKITWVEQSKMELSSETATISGEVAGMGYGVL